MVLDIIALFINGRKYRGGRYRTVWIALKMMSPDSVWRRQNG